ncbi:hypothetical protein ACWIUD_01560 [Helicobacter sp. 23-1044]
MKKIICILLVLFAFSGECFGVEYAYGSKSSGFFTGEQSGWIVGAGLGIANVKYKDYVYERYSYYGNQAFIETLATNTDKANRFQTELLAGMQLFFSDNYANRMYFTFAYLPNDMSFGLSYDPIVVNFVNKSRFNMGFYIGVALGGDIFSVKHIDKKSGDTIKSVETGGMYVSPNLGLRFVISKVHQLDLSFQYRYIVVIGDYESDVGRQTIAGSLRYIYNFAW